MALFKAQDPQLCSLMTEDCSGVSHPPLLFSKPRLSDLSLGGVIVLLNPGISLIRMSAGAVCEEFCSLLYSISFLLLIPVPPVAGTT